MWYIYQQNEQWVNSQTEPSSQFITIKRMPPRPVKSGYTTTLMADFTTEKVWYEQTITEDGMATQVRAEREQLLTACDWTQCLDAPIDTATSTAYREYRQALRDVTEQEGFPNTVIWPTEPVKTKAEPDPVDTAVDELLGGAE